MQVHGQHAPDAWLTALARVLCAPREVLRCSAHFWESRCSLSSTLLPVANPTNRRFGASGVGHCSVIDVGGGEKLPVNADRIESPVLPRRILVAILWRCPMV